ncbi:MAG: hypothetical protein U0401_06270, partial [Anaerolineae bacterium]
MKEQELKQILTDLAETAIPAENGAWPAIQARVQAHKQPAQSAGLSGGWLSMKKIVVMVGLVALLISLSVLALTPAVQAQVLAAIGFTIFGVEDNFLYPTYLPEGFSESAWLEMDGPQGSDHKLEQIEQKYHSGAQFVIISEAQAGDDRTLPEGRPLTVKGQPAVLVEGLSGTAEVGVTFEVSQEEGETGQVQVLDDQGQPQPATDNFEVFSIKSATPITIDYSDGRHLTWHTAELRLELLTNLPEAELLR